jgi:L-seryl-tRNA(Ser) seleniumtransferase
MSDSQASRFASLPSIDRLLNSTSAAELIGRFGRAEVKRVAQNTLAQMRPALKQGDVVNISEQAICLSIEQAFARDSNQKLRRVFNLTGTILHTNLGRAQLPQGSIDAVVEVMRGASNLEFDLETGKRGDRESHLEDLICRLTGADAATMVNNNAAAVMLVLNTLALGKEVPVSRGELVEIGGSFRIPDIIARSGCSLVEVGTTNRTHLYDFENAIGSQTAMIMKVHQSNYVIEGFTASVAETDLSELCARSSIPFVNDLGSGTLVNLEQYGLPHEPTPMDALQGSADIVTFSGDKLLGGPQAGFIVGRQDLLRQIKSNPMKRALRCDKMTIAAMSALLQTYARPETLPEHLPVLKMMMRSSEEIRNTAAQLVAALVALFSDTATISIVDCESEIGSGALPNRGIPSAAISIKPIRAGKNQENALNQIATSFRRLSIPVIGRIHKGAFLLDLRCLDDLGEFSAQLPSLKIAP